MTVENSLVLAVKRAVRERVPVLLPVAGRLYASTFGFRRERAYLRGRLKTDCEQPSLVLLSCNRAATQFTEDVLAAIYRKAGGRYVALNRYLFFADRDADRHFLDAEHMRALMRPTGYFFGQQGPFEDCGFLEEFKAVAMVRDPRDLVVSSFFSVTRSHVLRNRDDVRRIREAREAGIQRYVQGEQLLAYYEACLRQNLRLREKENVLCWRYEDMMERFGEFEASCQEFILGEARPELSAELGGRFKGTVTDGGEDAGRHRRSGRWGQFRTALEPETIRRLNARFEPLLDAFGYER